MVGKLKVIISTQTFNDSDGLACLGNLDIFGPIIRVCWIMKIYYCVLTSPFRNNNLFITCLLHSHQFN